MSKYQAEMVRSGIFWYVTVYNRGTYVDAACFTRWGARTWANREIRRLKKEDSRKVIKIL